VYLHGFASTTFQINGQETNLSTENIRLIEPVTEFDPLPQRDKKNYLISDIKFIETDFIDSEIEITWS